MQGFILHTQKVKDEDLIVYILSPKMLIKAYRFYGLRHSSILSGYKIDFALEENPSFYQDLKMYCIWDFYGLCKGIKCLFGKNLSVFYIGI